MAQGRAGIMGKSLIIRNPSISAGRFFLAQHPGM